MERGTPISVTLLSGLLAAIVGVGALLAHHHPVTPTEAAHSACSHDAGHTEAPVESDASCDTCLFLNTLGSSIWPATAALILDRPTCPDDRSVVDSLPGVPPVRRLVQARAPPVRA